jgi:adenine deaminase
VPRPGPDGGQLRGSVRLPALTADALTLPAPAPGRDVRVIRPVSGQIVTREERLAPTVQGGAVVADPERDLAKLVCVERHGVEGRVGVGLVTGFGLRRGALASTVGHDHHNLMLVGVDDDDLLAAARRAEALGGGLVVVEAGEVLAEVPLPLAGLLSDGPLERVQHELELVEAAAGRLGVREPGAFMTLSFLGLAVIPELRLTDHGLVDVRAATVVPLEAPAP